MVVVGIARPLQRHGPTGKSCPCCVRYLLSRRAWRCSWRGRHCRAAAAAPPSHPRLATARLPSMRQRKRLLHEGVDTPLRRVLLGGIADGQAALLLLGWLPWHSTQAPAFLGNQGRDVVDREFP